jgi:hypothetical protein
LISGAIEEYMKTRNYIFLVLTCFLVACSSVATPTTTPTQPKPTSTFAPTLTNTPAPTRTPQPTATPLGGSSGKIMFLSDSTLYTSNIDGSDKEVVISKTKLMEILAVEREDFLKSEIASTGWISPDGKKLLIWICILINKVGCVGENPTRFLLVATDLSLAKTITELSDQAVSGNPLWSIDSEKVLLQIPDIIGPGQASGSVEGNRTFIIEANEERFGEVARFGRANTAFWSLDAQRIYYFGSRNLAFANIDGSGKQVCETCSKWDGAVYTGTVSPDGERVAVLDTLKKLTITNSDFSNPVEFALSLSDNDVFPDYIQWSSDGKKLAIKVSTDGGTKHTIVIMDPDTGEQQELVVSQSNQSITLCGWSPDSKGVLYVRFSWETGVTELVFVDVTNSTDLPLFSLSYGESSCPIWLSHE